MDNRYEPPKTRVADQSADSGPRPTTVKIALFLVGLLIFVECHHQITGLTEFNDGEISGLRWLVDWLWVVGLIVISVLIARGRSWARWALAAYVLVQLYQFADALAFLSGFGSTEAISDFMGTVAMWMLPLSAMISLTAAILLFGPGRRWFVR
jgi:hypothetical protein